MPNGFVWYELMTSDAKAAESFYSSVVGWKATDSGVPGMSYTLLLAGATPKAGLMALAKEACDTGAKPGWVGYIGVDDVDSCVARVTKAGGATHVPPTDIPQVGRFAMLADPQGAVFCLFKPNTDMTPAVNEMQLGSIGWHELMAADGEKAFAFYAGLFGWSKAEAIDLGPMGRYQLFTAGGEPIGGMMTKPPEMPEAFWSYYFRVDSIGAALERLKAAGAQVINGPMEVPGGSWIVQAIDPQGAAFSLVGVK